MKHCKHCNIDVPTKVNYCPVCFNYFDEEENSKDNGDQFALYLTRSKSSKKKISNYFVFKLFFFISFCIIVVSSVVNYFTSKEIVWSLVVALSLLYVWILVAHTIISSRNPFEKVFFQLLGIIGLLWGLNYISKGTWLINYVLPSIMILATTVMVMMTMIAKKKRRLLISFFCFYLIFVIVSLVFLIFIKNTFDFIYLINLLYTGLIALGTAIFANKTLKNEFARKFHV